MARTTRYERHSKCFVVRECMLYMQEPKDHGEDKGIDFGVCRGLLTKIDERRLQVSVPEKGVV